MTSCWVTASISATASGVGGSAAADRLHDLGGDHAGGGVGLEHEHLHPAPQRVLVGLAPDPAHLGQGVALDHGGLLRFDRYGAVGLRPDAVGHRLVVVGVDRRDDLCPCSWPGPRSGPSRPARPAAAKQRTERRASRAPAARGPRGRRRSRAWSKVMSSGLSTSTTSTAVSCQTPGVPGQQAGVGDAVVAVGPEVEGQDRPQPQAACGRLQQGRESQLHLGVKSVSAGPVPRRTAPPTPRRTGPRRTAGGARAAARARAAGPRTMVVIAAPAYGSDGPAHRLLPVSVVHRRVWRPQPTTTR